MLASASTRSTPARGSLSPPRNLPPVPHPASHLLAPQAIHLFCWPYFVPHNVDALVYFPLQPAVCTAKCRNRTRAEERRRGKPCKRWGLGSQTKGKKNKEEKKKAHQAPKINYNRGRALADRTLMEAKTVDPAAIWRGASASWWHETRRTDSIDFLVVITTTTHRAQAEPIL